MKSLVIVLLLSTINVAEADVTKTCGPNGVTEAEFFGHVTDLKVEQIGTETQSYSYGIEFDMSRTFENPECPMDIKKASLYRWRGFGDPVLRNGQEVSGTLAFDPKSETYFLE